MPQLLVNNASNTVPVRLSAVPINCSWVQFIGCKTLAGPTGGPNTGKIQLGFSPTQNQQPLELAVGGSVQMFSSGGRIDLSQFYLAVATANDGVVAFYI